MIPVQPHQGSPATRIIYEKSADTVAIAAPVSAFLALGALAASSQAGGVTLEVLSLIFAIVAMVCHAVFAFLRSRLVAVLIRCFPRWGAARAPEIKRVKYRAWGLVLGALVAWLNTLISVVWLFTAGKPNLIWEAVVVYSLFVLQSSLYSLAFLSSHKSLRMEMRAAEKIPAAVKIRL